jgi:GTPase SAR1 family protein
MVLLTGAAAIVVGLGVAAVCAIVYVQQRDRRQNGVPLLDVSDENISSLLLLGPSQSGKSTLFRAAVALSGERLGDDEGDPARPTRGLVRRLLAIPTSDGRRRHLLVCDAGGARAEQRQWAELVRGRAVGALVFVTDAADGTKETRFLFQQLASAKWALSAVVVLALTKVDLVAGSQAEASALLAARADEYRAVCHRPMSIHYVNASSPDEASRLLVEVATGVAEASSISLL